jgi:hypothetical protein
MDDELKFLPGVAERYAKRDVREFFARLTCGNCGWQPSLHGHATWCLNQRLIKEDTRGKKT